MIAAGLALMAAWAGAARLEPLFRLDVFSGRHYLEDTGSRFAGNAAWAAAPAIRFSDKNALIPTLTGRYRRTTEARELAGGAFLVHEGLENRFNLKWVHAAAENFLVKPEIGFKNEMLSETKDEGLGGGLFDYHKMSAGLELERTGERLRSLRHAFNAYGVRFYNYRALAAARLGSEVRTGDDVLDFNGYDYSAAADFEPWEGTLLKGSFLGSYRDFEDQRVVTVAGNFSDQERFDLYWSGDFGLEQRFPRLGAGPWRLDSAGGFHIATGGLRSNQNHYDVGRLKFTPDFYDYADVTAGPTLTAGWWRVEAHLAYDFTRRGYRSRRAQREDGAYLEDNLFTNTHDFRYGLSIWLHKHVAFKAQGGYRLASSNTTYERVYRYNYHAKHFFAGMGLSF